MQLDPQGNIPKDFWSYDIRIDKIQKALQFIETGVDLLKRKPVSVEDDQEMTTGGNQRKILALISALKNSGWGPGDYYGQDEVDEDVCQFKVIKIKSSGFYAGCVCGKYFLINPKRPSQVMFLEQRINCIGIEDISFQKLGPNKYRLFVNKSAGENGCRASLRVVSIYDFDFSNGIYATYQYPEGSYAIDFNANANVASRKRNAAHPKSEKRTSDYSLVIYPDIGDGVHWPWVFSWDGVKWVNSNGRHWKYFKNGVIEPEAICGGSSKRPLLNALQKAIRDEEPLKYWK